MEGNVEDKKASRFLVGRKFEGKSNFKNMSVNGRLILIRYLFVCFFLVRQPPVGHGLLIYEVSRSHTTTDHSQ